MGIRHTHISPKSGRDITINKSIAVTFLKVLLALFNDVTVSAQIIKKIIDDHRNYEGITFKFVVSTHVNETE